MNTLRVCQVNLDYGLLLCSLLFHDSSLFTLQFTPRGQETPCSGLLGAAVLYPSVNPSMSNTPMNERPCFRRCLPCLNLNSNFHGLHFVLESPVVTRHLQIGKQMTKYTLGSKTRRHAYISKIEIFALILKFCGSDLQRTRIFSERFRFENLDRKSVV